MQHNGRIVEQSCTAAPYRHSLRHRMPGSAAHSGYAPRPPSLYQKKGPATAGSFCVVPGRTTSRPASSKPSPATWFTTPRGYAANVLATVLTCSSGHRLPDYDEMEGPAPGRLGGGCRAPGGLPPRPADLAHTVVTSWLWKKAGPTVAIEAMALSSRVSGTPGSFDHTSGRPAHESALSNRVLPAITRSGSRNLNPRPLHPE